MAFRDIDVKLYNDTVHIVYRDKPHKYYRTEMVEGKEKAIPVKGVTTIMDAVLEKKGLLTWPMGLALRELSGFYDFTNEHGEHLFGFSKGVGTLWDAKLDKDELLPLFQSASKAWQRKKKTGADVGSLVHDAIEQYTKGTPFDLTLEKYAEGLDEGFDEEQALKELEMAQTAFDAFVGWWDKTNPKLIGAEELVYSREFDYGGTFDSILEFGGKRYLVDYKTSNASASKDAAAPQGVYYSYFIQSGAYALALKEMAATTRFEGSAIGSAIVTEYDMSQTIDDLLIISARKDGGFDTVAASDLGLSVEDCIGWWKAVWLCHGMVNRAKTGLLNNVKEIGK